jgi:diadenosine tetraphosphate (Ap4A) HIT family hydrolase
MAPVAPRKQTVTAVEEPQLQPGDDCPFCNIAKNYGPFSPTQPPADSDDTLRPSITSPDQPETFMVLSTPVVLAFLDIAPLSRGHLLLCPRRHSEKLTAVSPDEARELGHWLRVVSAALVRATGVSDWNVVQNNGAAAAQVVPHMHFHIIPRPEIREQGRWSDRFTMFGRGTRTDLDDEEATELADQIRVAIADVLADDAASSKAKI